MKGKRVAVATGAVALVVLGVTVWVGWPRIRFWYRFESLGLNVQGYPEYRHRQTGIVFVRLPGGTFWMGAQKTDPSGQNYDPEAEDDEGPVHEVTLGPFLIGKYEVTQGQWKAVLGMTPDIFFKADPLGDDLPVMNVSWHDGQELCRKTGLQLPTEAQWEYACRAETTAPIAGTGKLNDMGWYAGNSEKKSHPVGQKAPNKFELHDLHGNILEWCEDVFDPEFYLKPESVRPDPVSTVGSATWVVRGGGWGGGAGDCRASSRGESLPVKWDFFFGLRVACRAP